MDATTIAELQELRAKYTALTERLSEAESAIRFYADPRFYGLSPERDGMVFQDRLETDRESADNLPTTRVAGMRARLYLKRWYG